MCLDTDKMWEIVSDFFIPGKPEDGFFDLLDELVSAAGIQCFRLECRAGHRAMVAPLFSLCTASKQSGDRLLVEGISKADVDASDNVVFVSTIREKGIVEDMFSLLNGGVISAKPPRLAAVLESSEKNNLLLMHLRSLGTVDLKGAIKLQEKSGHSVVFDLYPIPSNLDQFRQSLARGSDVKIAEGPDNLRRRAEWFRRHAGPRE